MVIQEKQIKYNYSNRKGTVKFIVIHDTGNTSKGANAMAHFTYFNGGDRNSSANIVVDDIQALELVNCNHLSAWHCGDGYGKKGITNDNSIGIELCVNSDGNYNKAVNNLVDVTKQLMKRFNIPVSNVVRHNDASGKICPRSMSGNNWSGWVTFKNKLSGGSTSTPTPPPPKPTSSYQKEYAETGRANVTTNALNVRDKPSTSGKIVATYYKGESFTYNHVIWNEGKVWVRYTSYSGATRFVCVKVLGGDRYANCV